MTGSLGDDRLLPVQSFRERRPVVALAPYVSSVWVQQVARHSAPYTHRTVPNGSAELVYEVGSLPRVIGPQSGPRVETLDAGTTVVGVRLRPGAVPCVFGVPASDLVDLTVECDQLWHGWPDELGDLLAATHTPDLAAATIEGAILARVAADTAAPDAVATEAVRRLHPGLGDSDVASLTSSLHVSERQLRRRCRTAIGFPPKVLHRMLRFQGLLAMARDHEQSVRGGLARLAADAGYADQAHMTRESMRLAGQSPRRLLLETAKHCGGSHDHAASRTSLPPQAARA
jgi:AraC-like DNA-binding protein